MKDFLFLLIAVAMSVLCGCDEDSFSRVVEIDVPEHEPKLVVNSLLNGGDSVINIRVSQSRGILDDEVQEMIGNAVVRVLQDGQLIGRVEKIDATGSYRLGAPQIFEPNQEFEIQVEARDFLNVTASDRVPTLVPMDVVTYEKDAAIDLDGGRRDLIRIEFQDPPGEENFYAIAARTATTEELFYVDQNGDTLYFQSQDDLYLDSNDPLLQYSYNYGLVTNDAAFDGKTVRLDVLTSIWQQGTDSIVVSLISLSRNGFLYDRSFTNFRDADGNPFAEPVTVHSNVDNGYGIFAVNGRSERRLSVK